MSGGYYRNWFGSHIITDNTLVTPEDFSPFCITAPAIHACPAAAGTRSVVCTTSTREVRPGQQRDYAGRQLRETEARQ